MSVPTYIVFDTETTGLPPRSARGEPPIPADDPRQPRMASFAGIVCDHTGAAIEHRKFYIRPDGWSIDGTEAAQVNGLSDAFLMGRGVPVSDALAFYSDCINLGLVAVAFNAVFDTKIMRGELRRAALPDLFEQTRNICVMKAQAAYVPRGLRMSGPGRIKLSDACAFHGIPQREAHDAMSDAEDARRLLEILIADDLLPAPAVTYSKHHAAA